MLGFICALVLIGPGRTFYLSPSGDDSNDGLSAVTAWRTIQRANQNDFDPGDTLLLDAGAHFAGHLELGPEDSGTPEHPVVIRSSDDNWATITSTDATAITASCGGIEVRDLKLVGGAIGAQKDHHGIALMALGQETRHVVLDHLDISGFGADGILIGAKQNRGFDGVEISHVVSHDNWDSGFSSWDGISHLGKPCRNRHLTVRDCQFNDNRGGSGFVVSGFDGGVVEYCSAKGNTGPGGGVGIWAWAATHIVFRYCIATGTRTGKGDGGGFDLDGACAGCVVEKCLSYGNDGPGFMHCDYPAAPSTHSNTICGSVSVNDGRKHRADTLGFGFVTWGSGLDRCQITGNTVFLTTPNASARLPGGLFVSFAHGGEAKTDVLHVRNCTFTSNRVILDCPTAAYVSLSNHLERTDLSMRANDYVGIRAPFVLDGKSYASLDDWKQHTGYDHASRWHATIVRMPALPANPRSMPKYLRTVAVG